MYIIGALRWLSVTRFTTFCGIHTVVTCIFWLKLFHLVLVVLFLYVHTVGLFILVTCTSSSSLRFSVKNFELQSKFFCPQLQNPGYTQVIRRGYAQIYICVVVPLRRQVCYEYHQQKTLQECHQHGTKCTVCTTHDYVIGGEEIKASQRSRRHIEKFMSRICCFIDIYGKPLCSSFLLDIQQYLLL